MTTLVLSVGIAVTFLTVWGVIMVGAYLIGREPSEVAPAVVAPRRASGLQAGPDRSRLG